MLNEAGGLRNATYSKRCRCAYYSADGELVRFHFNSPEVGRWSEEEVINVKKTRGDRTYVEIDCNSMGFCMMRIDSLVEHSEGDDWRHFTIHSLEFIKSLIAFHMFQPTDDAHQRVRALVLDFFT